jgi:hypothetical protein
VLLGLTWGPSEGRDTPQRHRGQRQRGVRVAVVEGKGISDAMCLVPGWGPRLHSLIRSS